MTTAIEQAIERLSASTISAPARERVTGALERRLNGEDGGDGDNAYLAGITVEGFRGVAVERTLKLKPGPGLTLVVGRNGSGKSSFAEGLEVVLTGTSVRWEGRTADWKKGWRNLHHDGDSRVEARFHLEGINGTTTVARQWTPGDALDTSDGWAQHAGQKRAEIEELGWSESLSTVRPLLSYNELGSMLEQGPSKLHDALAAILGIGDVTDSAEELRQSRLALNKTIKASDATRAALTEALGGVPGGRAARARALLSKKSPDLEPLESLVLGGEITDDERDRRHVVALDLPTSAEAEADHEVYASAYRTLSEMEGTEAARAQELASLLRATLDYHAAHDGRDCPVCGRSAALDDDWRSRTEAATARLERDAKSYRDAEAAVETALAVLQKTVPEIPASVLEAHRDELAGVLRWRDLLEGDTSGLAERGRAAIAEAATAMNAVRDALRSELSEEEEEWRPMAARIAEWLPDARNAQTATFEISTLKEGEDWLNAVAGDMRVERFEPLAERAKEIWSRLSVNSNVSLDEVVLAGKTTHRRVDLSVSVDGEPGVALGVMSQGELHSLALSLFLPRATQPTSPFRFVVIDDPVQAMDPAKVDGLATVLSDIAKTHQVLVFTHDDRLRTALRRLDLAATIIEVTRRAGSHVELVQVDDPIDRHIESAKALAQTQQLPPDMAAEVIPGFCRQAIEAACQEVVWLRHAGSGRPATETEDLLVGLKTSQYLAMALFDDAGEAGRVLGKLNSWNPRFADVFTAVNKGSHGGYDGSYGSLINDTQGLCKRLRETA